MPFEWMDMADMATEMREVKHPYPKKAIALQAGVDF
jgi:ATP:corrinoid adenosyltransferase